MHYLTTWLAVLGFLALTTASPLRDHQPRQDVSNATSTTPTSTTSTPSGNLTNPCAQVAVSYSSQLTATATPTVPAQVAYECLTSVPLNTTSALELISSLRPYIRWQSTTAYLAKPPAEYVEKVQPAWDLWAGLDGIESNLTSKVWTSEYSFGWSLYRLFQSAHDGHLAYVPDSVGNIFAWGRPIALASISEDSKSLPLIFTVPDILAGQNPSPVTKINGEDAVSYLENFSEYGHLQDRDALYNNMLYELASVALEKSGTGSAEGMFTGGGRGRWVYPGAETTLTFENGTTKVYTNFARVLKPFTGIRTGEDVADAFFYYESSAASAQEAFAAGAPTGEDVAKLAMPALPGDSAATPSSVPGAPVPTTSASSGSAAPTGYPSSPLVQDSSGYMSGYYLDGDYADTAVLSIRSFEVYSGTFQRLVSQFLQQAQADGKTKLLVDLSANGGGTLLEAYDLFKQLFPKEQPNLPFRYRAHEAFNLIGEKFSELSENYTGSRRNLNDITDGRLQQIVASSFNYRTDLTKDSEHFTSWEEKFGPEVHNGDNFTSLMLWDLNDPLITVPSGGIEISGYGNLSNVTQQPFEAANIVLVFDGYCASTCSIFSELMHQAGVKRITFGGRPQTGEMQAVGGTRGVMNQQFSYIQALVQYAYQYATPEDQARFNASDLGAIRSNYVPYYRSASSLAPTTNARDGIVDGDTPLQFQWDPADCRIWWTKEMIVDITEVWKAAADSSWGTNSKCVAGASTNV